jgi:CheY-like chemotaxis protein
LVPAAPLARQALRAAPGLRLVIAAGAAARVAAAAENANESSLLAIEATLCPHRRALRRALLTLVGAAGGHRPRGRARREPVTRGLRPLGSKNAPCIMRFGAKRGCSAAGGIAAGHSVCLRSTCDDGSMRPTVVIVDDHEDFRDSARVLLEAEGFEVIGEASDGTEALAAVTAIRPSIVLLDIQLPGLDGFAVAEQIAGIPDPPAVVLISSRDAAVYGPRLVQTSARGFLPKNALSGEALAALVG